MIRAFGADGAAFELDEERVRVQPKVLALFRHLARDAARVG
jgi:hypothetical protein